VKSTSGALIDPCQWGELRTTVTVADGVTSSGIMVRLKTASALNVRIADTVQAFALKGGESYPPHVMVGPFDMQGVFHPAIEAQKDATGINYQLAIPVDSPVRLTVYSAKVKLVDAQNVPVPPQGHTEIVVHPSGQSALKSFTFNAVGRN
jgi:hypothetical protein